MCVAHFTADIYYKLSFISFFLHNIHIIFVIISFLISLRFCSFVFKILKRKKKKKTTKDTKQKGKELRNNRMKIAHVHAFKKLIAQKFENAFLQALNFFRP